MRKAILILAGAALVWAVGAQAQDEPSLGDVARQSRQQKQQKDAQAKQTAPKDGAAGDAQGATDSAVSKRSRVIENENFPAPNTSTGFVKRHSDNQDREADASNQNDRAEQVRSAIQSQKDGIASLKQEIEELSNSIHYAGGNCVANCVQWNERQKEKQDEVERLKAQVEEQQKRLEEMQESARKQGFGSSVYEP